MWATTVDLPTGKEIHYRFFICAKDPSEEDVHIRQWETHLRPRKLDPIGTGDANKEAMESFDTFGEINGSLKIDRGWLTTETVLQFIFYKNPFMLKERMKDRKLFVKVSLDQDFHFHVPLFHIIFEIILIPKKLGRFLFAINNHCFSVKNTVLVDKIGFSIDLQLRAVPRESLHCLETVITVVIKQLLIASILIKVFSYNTRYNKSGQTWKLILNRRYADLELLFRKQWLIFW